MLFLKKLAFYFRYLSNPPWDTGISPPELVDFVANNPPGRALELGCGTGTNAIYLAKHGWQVTAVDFVRKAISQARIKAKYEGVKVRFLVKDVARLRGVTGPFDLILDIGCFHSLSEKDRQAYLHNVSEFLHRKGLFLLYAMVSPTGQEFGLTNTDLEQMQAGLELVARQDGTDRGRHSAWFTWRKPTDQSSGQ